MKVSELLLVFKLFGPYDNFTGICDNVRRVCRRPEWDWEDCLKIWNSNMTRCFIEWDKFSGDKEYPIPGVGLYTPRFAYSATNAKMMWNPNHPYGKMRLELLEHCIEWFKSRGW